MSRRLVHVTLKHGRSEVEKFETHVDPDDGLALWEVLRDAVLRHNRRATGLGEYRIVVRETHGRHIKDFTASGRPR